MLHLNLIFLCVLSLSGFAMAAVTTIPPEIELSPQFVPLHPTSVKNAHVPDKVENKTTKKVEDADYWNKIALKQLEKIIATAKKTKENLYAKKAKNIIIFIGDGMGMTTITAGRIYKGQLLKHGFGEEEKLAFDEFPYTGLAKTYNVDKQVPDSAGTATAMFCGVKTDYGAIGMDMTRSPKSAQSGRLQSIMDWAQAVGKRTGIVTTTRITHATPAAAYARIYHRDWECDSSVPTDSVGIHADIARQLIENAPGNKLNVILGGGLSPMGAENKNETSTTKFEGTTESVCTRWDKRNLVNEWLHMDNNTNRVFVQTQKDLLNADLKKVDHLMGLFRNNHITYALSREEDEPTLQEMVESAIKVLDRGHESKGYVLLVEGGRIDQAHHQNYAHAALHEVYEFDLAVQAALNNSNPDETLIIVTADHSHSVTMNGYPNRGNDILGFANKKSEFVYETITYANGPGYFDHVAKENELHKSTWIPLDVTNRTAANYRHVATLPLNDETHGGEDVIVFAQGPGASLVRGVFEQNYLAYIMSYAGCMGPAKDFDNTCKHDIVNHTSISGTDTVVYSCTLLLLTVLINLLNF